MLTTWQIFSLNNCVTLTTIPRQAAHKKTTALSIMSIVKQISQQHSDRLKYTEKQDYTDTLNTPYIQWGGMLESPVELTDEQSMLVSSHV